MQAVTDIDRQTHIERDRWRFTDTQLCCSYSKMMFADRQTDRWKSTSSKLPCSRDFAGVVDY